MHGRRYIVGGRIAAQLKAGNLDFLLTGISAFKRACGSNGQGIIFQNAVKLCIAAIQCCIGFAVIDFVFCGDTRNRNRLGVDRNGCGIGVRRVFSTVGLIGGECPLGIMAARVGIHGRCVPCKCTGDGCAGVGVFHLASDAAVAQCLTIGNLACGDFAVLRHGGDLVHRADLDSQSDVLIVARGDCNRNRAELSFVRAASVCFQCQLTGLAVYKGNKGANAQIGINLLVIGDRAVVTGSSQLRQQR